MPGKLLSGIILHEKHRCYKGNNRSSLEGSMAQVNNSASLWNDSLNKEFIKAQSLVMNVFGFTGFI